MWQKNGNILGTGRGKFDYKVGKRKEEEKKRDPIHEVTFILLEQ